MFDLPVHFNSEYIEFLRNNSKSIYSVYYASTNTLPSDARISDTPLTKETIIHFLSDLPFKKYMTLNGRITDPQYYQENFLKQAVLELQELHAANALTGIIVLDFYYLNMLSKFGLKDIEIIPSINHAVDTISKLNVVVNHIHSLGYTLSKIILDRGLNRDIEKFREVSQYAKKLGLQVEILVNEGCIQHCPYKFTHDAIISQTNSKLRFITLTQTKDLSTVNNDYGCIKHFEEHISDVLKIPFIRPEDLHYFEPHFDIIKISGKVKSDDFVYTAFKAYSKRSWNGNLLSLLDATGGASHKLYVFNDMIPKTFVNVLTSCQSKCHSCSYCDDLKVIQKL